MNKLTPRGIAAAAEDLGVEQAVVKAVLDVESSGSGFLKSGKPKILFEGHYFHKLTGGKYSRTHPTISYPKWTKQFYKGGEREWSRFNEAFRLDPDAAMQSASWGLGQVMGQNYRKCGFRSVGEMVDAVKSGEDAQLQMMIDYIQSVGLDDELQSRDWASFARGYNGSGYKRNNYDSRLAAAYKRHKREPSAPMTQVPDHQEEMVEDVQPDGTVEPDLTGDTASVPAQPSPGEVPVTVGASGQTSTQETVIVPPAVPVDSSSKKSFWATVAAAITAAVTWIVGNVSQIFGAAKETGFAVNDAVRWTLVILGVVFALYMLRQLVMGVVRLLGSIAMTRDAMRYHADPTKNNVVVGQPAPPREVQ